MILDADAQKRNEAQRKRLHKMIVVGKTYAGNAEALSCIQHQEASQSSQHL